MSHHLKTRFSIRDWYGKQFPINCLQHPDLEFHCDHLRSIPPCCPVEYDINVHLPIQTFFSSTFPSHRYSSVIEAASDCFSDNPPNETLETLVDEDIPPPKFIQDARSQFGQAVLDRRRSIRDPLYDKSFLPFWVITLWERLADLNVARNKWTSAIAWFQCFSKTMDQTTATTAKRHLACTGWDAEIKIGRERATTLTLPQLLADGCLGTTILDLMAEYTQVEASYCRPTQIHICGSIFATQIARFRRRGEGPPGWFLERFIDPVEKHEWKTLYFPMFWPEHNHWVSVRVDFAAKRVSIG